MIYRATMNYDAGKGLVEKGTVVGLDKDLLAKGLIAAFDEKSTAPAKPSKPEAAKTVKPEPETAPETK